MSSSRGDDWEDNGSSSDDDWEGWTEEEKKWWHEAVTSVYRKSGPHLTRVADVYDRRAPAVLLTQETQGRLADFMTVVHRWNGFSSGVVIVGGLKANADRMNEQKQNEMLQSKAPTNLVKELPPDPSRPFEPGHWRDDPWSFIKDLMTR